MPLETGDYISDLVETNPAGTDPKSQGDDHLRLIKKCVQQSFPQVAGAVDIAHGDFLSRSRDETVSQYWKFNGLDITGNFYAGDGGLFCYGAGLATFLPQDQRRYFQIYGLENFRSLMEVFGETDGSVTWNAAPDLTGVVGGAGTEFMRFDMPAQNFQFSVPVQGIAPVAAADLTRKDYVDQEAAQAEADANAYTDAQIAALGVTPGEPVIGGLRIQRGRITSAGAETPVTFPVAFSGTPNVVLTGEVTAAQSNNDDPGQIIAGSVTSTGFTASTSNSSVVDFYQWIAIGPA